MCCTLRVAPAGATRNASGPIPGTRKPAKTLTKKSGFRNYVASLCCCIQSYVVFYSCAAHCASRPRARRAMRRSHDYDLATSPLVHGQRSMAAHIHSKLTGGGCRPSCIAGQSVNERMHCDICLFSFTSREEYLTHLQSLLHSSWLEVRNRSITSLFRRAALVLERQEGSWERCFDCGAVNCQTVVRFLCCRCDGGGGRVPSDRGIPGVFFEGSMSRYLCERHALKTHCRSCSTPTPESSYEIDPDALERE